MMMAKRHTCGKQTKWRWSEYGIRTFVCKLCRGADQFNECRMDTVHILQKTGSNSCEYGVKL